MRDRPKPVAGDVMSGHMFTLDEIAHAVWLSRAGKAYLLHAGDAAIGVDLQALGPQDFQLHIDGRIVPVVVAVEGDVVHVHMQGAAHSLRYSDALTRLSHQGQGAGADSVPAPMPGTVVAVHVAAGAQVRRGEALLVMESMKLETSIGAPRDGVIKTVHVELGRSFERGALLVTLEPASGGAT